jgi:hypothetical protein
VNAILFFLKFIDQSERCSSLINEFQEKKNGIHKTFQVIQKCFGGVL